MAEASIDSSDEDIFQNYAGKKGIKPYRFDPKRRRLNVDQPAENDEENASNFFKKISLETGVRISWPTKLSTTPKKADPYIKLSGSEESIIKARKMIFSRMENRKTATMKIDVQYSDHPHMIGKGGEKINKLMQRTGCHIHFPDSNKTTDTSKSNLVTLSGHHNNINDAIKGIRISAPLMITLKYKNQWIDHDVVNNLQPWFRQLKVTMTSKMEGGITKFLFRGEICNKYNLKLAIMYLRNNMGRKDLCNMSYENIVEITPKDLNLVKENLETLLKNYENRDLNIKIVFPQKSTDKNINTASNSSRVIIAAETFDELIEGRSMILSCLPVTLIFEVASNMNNLSSLMSLVTANSKIQIEFRTKPKTCPTDKKDLGAIGSEMRQKRDKEGRRDHNLMYFIVDEFPAMVNEPSAGVKRVPTDTWVGLGFSLSTAISNTRRDSSTFSKPEEFTFNKTTNDVLKASYDYSQKDFF
ncbi:Protein bicaudal C 1 [Nymphon striatum]|nr:Protein bicaudal C 1 [Nymphon striatum]